MSNPPFTTALLAGAIAGTTVDLSLFPLDTLKTRLQSTTGFFASGGFTGIYRGVGSAVVGSAPGAAFFFVTYESAKSYLSKSPSFGSSSGGGVLGEAGTHMLAASLGEVAACAVRVPTEVVKQRAQAGLHGGRSLASLRAILDLRGTRGVGTVWRELYRGWGITVFREVPFTVIQFPLWEALKSWGRSRRQASSPSSLSSSAASQAKTQDVPAYESALYGSLSGAFAAGATTPLDVLKTRVMLSPTPISPLTVLSEMMRNGQGWRALFAGFVPRVTWISVGGAVFLGSYQWVVNELGGL